MNKKTDFQLHLDKPIRLIAFEDDGSLKLQSQGKKFFKDHLQTPCAFISIIGQIRQGKSLLMNLMLETLNGPSTNSTSSGKFSMSDGLESHTKGVFIFPVPIQNAGVNYYFIDCQGKENKKEEDIKLFTLICLMSSLCVFQSMKTITYEHDFILPYLRSRKHIRDVLAKDSEHEGKDLIINPNLKLLFLVRDCPDSKTKEIHDVFRKVFLEHESPPEVEEAEFNMKKQEIEKRNNVREILRTEFDLSEKDIFNLPYYLDKVENDYKFTKFNDQLTENHLSKEFVTKTQMLLKNFIIGHIQPLGYNKRRGVFLPLKGQELCKIVEVYIKMINEGKVHNIFNEMELIMTKIKEELFNIFLPALQDLFAGKLQEAYHFANLEDFSNFYKNMFERLQEQFKQESTRIGKVYQTKIPNYKILQWLEDLQSKFQEVLLKEMEVYQKELEIRRLKRGAEEAEQRRREEEERRRYEAELREQQRRRMEEEQRRQREEEQRQLEEEERLLREELERRRQEEHRLEEARIQRELDLARAQEKEKQQQQLLELMELEESFRNNVPGKNNFAGADKNNQLSALLEEDSQFEDSRGPEGLSFYTDVSELLDISPEEAKIKAEGMKSELKYTQKNTLDMRVAKNKRYLDLIRISQMDQDLNTTIHSLSASGVDLSQSGIPISLLPKNKDGSLNLRFKENKIQSNLNSSKGTN
jgi:hypothetical protein